MESSSSLASEVILSDPVINRLCSNLSWDELINLSINKKLEVIPCTKKVQDVDRVINSFTNITKEKIKLAKLIELVGSRTALLHLIIKKDLRTVRLLLESGLNSNFLVNLFGRISVPLTFAILISSKEMVQLLLDLGSDLNLQKRIDNSSLPILSIIPEIGQQDRVNPFELTKNSVEQEILELAPQFTSGPFYFAINDLQVDPEVVQLLIESGINLNDPLSRGDGYPLNVAISNWDENPEVLLMLLKAGARVDARGENAPAIIEEALDNRIDDNPGLIRILFNYLPSDNPQLLQRLLNKTVFDDRNIVLTRKLLQKGADPNILSDEGMSLLSAAIVTRSTKTIELLLEYGADPNLLSDDGTTPISDAITRGNIRVLYLFLKRGADPNKILANGNTLLEEAFNSNRSDSIKRIDIIGMLIAKGAKITPKVLGMILDEKTGWAFIDFVTSLSDVNMKIDGLTLLDILDYSTNLKNVEGLGIIVAKAQYLIGFGGKYSPEYRQKYPLKLHQLMDLSASTIDGEENLPRDPQSKIGPIRGISLEMFRQPGQPFPPQPFPQQFPQQFPPQPFPGQQFPPQPFPPQPFPQQFPPQPFPGQQFPGGFQGFVPPPWNPGQDDFNSDSDSDSDNEFPTDSGDDFE